MNAKALQRFRAFADGKQERCELCALPLPQAHQHLLDPPRKIVCCCDGCAVLFDEGGKTRLKRIPREARRLGNLEIPESWERAALPVKLAFFVSRPLGGRSYYPSPAGLTEDEVSEDDWLSLVNRNPVLKGMLPEVEALVVNRLGGEQYLIAPLDRCFALAGLLRRYWSGISGGEEVWERLKGYLGKLQEDAR
jgi:hypothetical protein